MVDPARLNLSFASIHFSLGNLDSDDGGRGTNDDATAISYRVLDRQISSSSRAAGDVIVATTTTTDADADYDVTNLTTAVAASTAFVSLNYSTPVMIIIAVVLSVVIIATVFGNLLVGVALFRFRSLRTVSNFLIGNLALSDFLLATTVLPLSTVNECLGHWVFGRAACNVWLLVDVLCCTASLWNICVIALDRFTATLYPIWYRERRSSHQALLYVALVWTISTAVCLPPLLGWNDLSNNYERDNATDVHRCNLFQTPSYVLYSASMSFFVPFFLTVFLYVQIFIVLRERMRKMRAKNSTGSVNNGGGGQRPPTAMGSVNTGGGVASAVVGSRQHQRGDENRLLLPPEAIGPDGVTIGAESTITVVEMATFNSTPACSGRRSTDLTSLKSLCSDGGVVSCVPSSDDPAASATSGRQQQQQLVLIPAVATTSSADDPAAVPTDTSTNDCLHCLFHVTRLLSGANRRLTVASGNDDVESPAAAAAGNGRIGFRRNRLSAPAAVDAAAACRRVGLEKESTRFDDDGDVRTALMSGAVVSAPGTPEVNSSAGGGGSQTAMQRRRQRFKRFATASSNAFRSSTSSMTGDPRGATMKSSAARRFEQREMQATIRMAIIIAFFCGMWLGFFTVYVIQAWCPTTLCTVPRALDAFFFWLGYSNSSINPILYTIFNDDFRRAFRKLVSCTANGGKGGIGGRDQFAGGSRIIDRHGQRDASITLKNDRA